MKKVLSIDVGGTKISYAEMNEKGEFLGEIKRVSTPKQIDELTALLKKIVSQNDKNVDCVAFATAGAVNLENTGIDFAIQNMPVGYNLLEFSKLSEKPVFVENDANAAAWAEYKVGAAIGDKNTVIITIGTGIGGGIIVDGRLLRGKSGRAGEVGSIKINGRGRICTCQRKNCWESYASGTGLKRTAEEIAQNDDIFKTSIYKDKKPAEITTYDIVDGVKQNDEYSQKVFEIWQNDLIIGLINVMNIFDSESIVISGGMGECINIEEIENAVNAEIIVSPVKIKHAKAGNYAGMIGAAILSCEKLFS